MDEHPLYHSNKTWYFSPYGPRMSSWEQPSNFDDREYTYRSSNTTNTPQRGPAIGRSADEHEDNGITVGPSPFPAGRQYPPYPSGETRVESSFSGFPMFDVYGFPAIPGYHAPPQHPITLTPRPPFDDTVLDISPPPAAKRTTRSSSPDSGSSGPSKKPKPSSSSSSPDDQESLLEHRNASEQNTAERVHATTVPHPSAMPYYGAPTEAVATAAARLYAIDDNAMADSNSSDEASLPKKLSVQAARKPAPKKKTSKPKAKKATRRHAKKAPTRKAAVAASKSKSKSPSPTRFEPSKEELVEAHNARAQQALRTWYTRLGELHDYKLEKGDCSVPQKYPENPPLGTWVNKQRMEYKNLLDGEKHSLTETKFQKMEEIGFDWGKRKGDHSWEERYQQLAEYKKKHGSCKYSPFIVFLNACLCRHSIYSLDESTFVLLFDEDRQCSNQVRREPCVGSLGEHPALTIQAL